RADTEVDVLVVKEHSDFRAFGSGRAFIRLLLEKISGRLGQRPRRFIENTVNLDRISDPFGLNSSWASVLLRHPGWCLGRRLLRVRCARRFLRLDCDAEEGHAKRKDQPRPEAFESV